MSRRNGFTLIEVMVALAIVALVVTGGFSLIGNAARTLAEIDEQRVLMDAAQKLHLDFLTKEGMADGGEKDGVSWKVQNDSLPVIGDVELTFRKLIVEYKGERKEWSMTLYLPE